MNDLIHGARSPCRQRSPALRTFQSSERATLRIRSRGVRCNEWRCRSEEEERDRRCDLATDDGDGGEGVPESGESAGFAIVTQGGASSLDFVHQRYEVLHSDRLLSFGIWFRWIGIGFSSSDLADRRSAGRRRLEEERERERKLKVVVSMLFSCVGLKVKRVERVSCWCWACGICFEMEATPRTLFKTSMTAWSL